VKGVVQPDSGLGIAKFVLDSRDFPAKRAFSWPIENYCLLPLGGCMAAPATALLSHDQGGEPVAERKAVCQSLITAAAESVRVLANMP